MFWLKIAQIYWFQDVYRILDQEQDTYRMILSIIIVEYRSTSKHKFEIEFEFGVEVIVKLNYNLSSRTQVLTSIQSIVTMWELQFKVDIVVASLKILYEKQ